jgi:hypothetical protein
MPAFFLRCILRSQIKRKETIMISVEEMVESVATIMGSSRISLVNGANNSTCSIAYPIWQVRNRTVLEFESREHFRHFATEKMLQNISTRKITYQGEMSVAGKKKMTKVLMCWAHAIELYNAKIPDSKVSQRKMVVFLTCTLSSSQWHADKEIKSQILKPFMRILREDFGCSNYIWKAESQKNGNIHFHILIDKYLAKDKVQEIWNECQEKLGYVSRFKEKFGHNNPPSTNIQVVKNQSEMEKYIGKYVGKGDQYRLIDGAVWKASKKLSTVEYFEIERDTAMDKNCQRMTMDKDVSFKTYDHCNVIDLKEKKITDLLSTSSLRFFNCYCNALVSFLLKDNEFFCFYDQLFDMRVKWGLSKDFQLVDKIVAIAHGRHVVQHTQGKLFNEEILKAAEKRKNCQTLNL